MKWISEHRLISRGFTLIELIVAVAIVALLASLSLPTYQHNVQKSKRLDAKTSLLAAMQAQERFFSNNMRYSDDLSDIGFESANPKSIQGYYTLSAHACEQNIKHCIQLIATAEDRSQDNISLDSLGNRTPASVW